jgi:hypothetical protein
VAVEDQAHDAFEAVTPRDERPEARPGSGVELLHAAVGALAAKGVVADVEEVAGGRRDGALLQRLQRRAGAARPRARGPGGNLEQEPGCLSEAIKSFETVRELDGENGEPETLGRLGHAYGLAGRKDDALKLI